MELVEVLGSRHMTRCFSPVELDGALLREVLEAARRAPSAGFAQGVDLLVLTAAARRARFWELASEAQWRATPAAEGLLAAPAIVVPVADPASYVARYHAPDKRDSWLGGRDAASWPVPYWLIDAAFAAMLMLLRAGDLGLGSLFFQLRGDEESLLSGLGVPPGRVTIGALAIGVDAGAPAKGSPTRIARRPYGDVVHEDRW